MRTLSAFLSVLLSLSVIVRAQENVVVEENDPSLVYNPPKTSWSSNKNPQPGPNGTSIADYFHGGGYLSIAIVGASVTLTFNGSYIAYYSDLYFTHGEMEIDLDGSITGISTRSQNYPEGTPNQKLFEAYVDPNRASHTITLTNKEARTMALDYFIYTAVRAKNTEQHSPASAPTKGDTPHAYDLPVASSMTSPEQIPGTPNNPTSTAPIKPQNSPAAGASTPPPAVSSADKGVTSTLASDESTTRATPSISTTTIVLVSVVSTMTLLFIGLGVCCCRLRRRAGKEAPTGSAPSAAGRRLISGRTSSSSITPFFIQPTRDVASNKSARASTRFASDPTSAATRRPDSDAWAINLSTPPSYAQAHITQ